MIEEKIKAIIENNPVSLGTITIGNKPNIIVVAYVKVADSKTIIITDNYMKQTVEDVIKDEDICLVAWDEEWNGVKIVGKASYHNDGDWLNYVKSLKENEGCPAKGAVVVKVEKIIELK